MKTPWYLSDKFFSIFFATTLGAVIFVFLLTIAIYAGSIFLLSKQDFSKGILPPVERVLCGEPGCLKSYLSEHQDERSIQH